ncbi:Sterol regulatory element-binding protein 1 [Taphrina deformans PYCC 5710]|uniref:Sterol regulatory element-binding protein 1 n=1 Tax=Taphrina deformans (strain PYCC 5710 / ATCC 11124 / CBS 356.35 / IMI 108563 / JCM 9778 / NBRC 8474) TaxID=1097556 RepID=R4XFU3_TAPDE|nr:Sterol regulatory element-binding protein 1 [Taphrina deformans PYCC 5710]|eukprot:CCG82239.1 Sterol regulatory element-binding protein 1 [Taphrina deformans PYCC 5710]
MSFEDFLVPMIPGLIYDTHSEQSQSPKSNLDTSLSFEADWLNWDANADGTNDHIEPIISVSEPSMFGAQYAFPGDLTIKSANDQANIYQIEGSKVVAPDLLLNAHSSVAPPLLRSNDSSENKGTKRKMSDSSEDLFLSNRALSSSREDSPGGMNANADGSMLDSRRPMKVSHNVIEKRYRSNLNEKIMVLRDSVPALKAEALSANVKHPKGKIIQAATEYIRDIEAKCARLQEDNNRLMSKLHGEPRPKSGGPLAKVVVGGLATMMCLNTSGESGSASNHTKRALQEIEPFSKASCFSFMQSVVVVTKMLLLIAAVVYVINPNLFTSAGSLPKERLNEKYSQSALDDTMQEDVQENREAMHDNVSAMLEMPCDRPGLFKRILQGCFVLFLEILIGQSGWNVLINRGLDYALTRQNACRMLIETQLLGGDKYINQAKLFLSAIQSLGYRMPKEMRALHFAMVCHGYAPAGIVRWCISLFWSSTSQTGQVILQLPLNQLFSARVLEAMWAWTTGIEDPLIANVRSDETIDTPLKQLASIHAALMQNQILRDWLRGSETASALAHKMDTLLDYCPRNSRILINSLYLKSMIEPNDWLERAMLKSISVTEQADTASSLDVSMQLRCCVLLNLLEKNPKVEEVSDVLQMAEVETSSLLPGYSSRIVANCIAKHRLDDDDGISEALRRIFAKIGGTSRLELQ